MNHPPDDIPKEVHDHYEAEAERRGLVAPCSDNSPWPMAEVLAKLCEAADILLDDKNYDGHGHELIDAARREARMFLHNDSPRRARTAAFLAKNGELSQTVGGPLRHPFSPHRKYPWFCKHCGYPEWETLKHIQKEEGQP